MWKVKMTGISTAHSTLHIVYVQNQNLLFIANVSLNKDFPTKHGRLYGKIF